MAKVKPVPEGYHTVAPYLVVDGAAKAIEWYKKALGAVEMFSMPGPGGKLMHGEFRIGDSPVMIADEFPDWGVRGPKAIGGSPVSIFLYVEDVDKLFNQAVAAGATVLMPVADQFWGDRYGKLEDPFGHRWDIATHKEDLTPEEIAKRGAAAMAQQK